MPALKDPKQLESHDEYKKAAAADAKAVGGKPVRFLCFPRYPFAKGALPAMLIGDVPSAVVTVAKKKGGAFIAGRMRKTDKQMDFEVTSGKFEATMLSNTLKTLGVALPAAPAKMESDGEPQGLKEKAPGAEFKDENKKVGWRTEDPKIKESDRVTTRYFNPQEKEASKVKFDDKGNILDAQGNKIKGKEVGFVMDPKNAQVHQFDTSGQTHEGGKTQNTHHTSPLSGGNVAGAGLIKTTDKGRIDTIKDQSGHYKPDATYAHQVVKELGKDKDAQGFSKNLVDRSLDSQGKPINKPAKVELMGKKGLSEDEFATVKGDVGKINALIAKKFGDKAKIVLAASQANNLKYINILIGQTTSVTVTTQQFEQTQGNEAQIRNKQSVNEELLAKTKKVKAEKPPVAPPKVGANNPLRSSTTSSGYSAPPVTGSPKKGSYDAYTPGKVGADGYTDLTKSPPPKVGANSPLRSSTTSSGYSAPPVTGSPKKGSYDAYTPGNVGADGYTDLTKTPPKTGVTPKAPPKPPTKKS